MPFTQVAYLLVAILGVVVLTGKLRLHLFLAIVAVTVAYGCAVRGSVSMIGRTFGAGFVETLQSVGLVIVAAGIIATIAQRSGAAARLALLFESRRRRWGVAAVMVPLGFATGIAASAAAVFAALTPLREALAGAARRDNAIAAITLGLALLASHGLLPPAPGPIAAAAILGADPLRVALYGVPVAIVAAIVAAAFAIATGRRVIEADEPPRPAAPHHPPTAAGRNMVALVVPVALMVALLLVRSLGEIPSEPLGGGTARALLLGVGRPPILLVAGVATCLIATWRWDAAVLSEHGWVGQAIADVATLLLIVGAGGGFQRLLQDTGMAPDVAESLLGWHAGLLLPFALAAVIKVLQGSSMVAAITASGMVQPALGMLGLDGDVGRALAAIAVGAGSVTGSHINDGYFWLVTGSARVRPGQGLVLHGLGSILLGVAALGALFAIAAIAR